MVTLQWVQCLSNSILLSAFGWGLWPVLTRRKWQGDRISLTWLYYIAWLRISRLECEILLLALKNQTTMLWNCCGECHLAGNGEGPIRSEDSLYSIAIQRLGPPLQSYKEMHFANNLNEPRRGFFTNEAPSENVAWLTS